MRAATGSKRGSTGRGRPSAGLDLDMLQANARKASEFLKALSHEVRLLILCFLIDGETYVRRKPALLVARKSGQIKPGSLGLNLGELYSEDVW